MFFQVRSLDQIGVHLNHVIEISRHLIYGTLKVWIEVSVPNFSNPITILPGRPMPYNHGWSNYLPCAASTVPHSFPSKDSLMRHHRLRGNHPESRFQCKYCNYISKYSSNVYKHVRRIHKHMPFFKPNRL